MTENNDNDNTDSAEDQFRSDDVVPDEVADPFGDDTAEPPNPRQGRLARLRAGVTRPRALAAAAAVAFLVLGGVAGFAIAGGGGHGHGQGEHGRPPGHQTSRNDGQVQESGADRQGEANGGRH